MSCQHPGTCATCTLKRTHIPSYGKVRIDTLTSLLDCRNASTSQVTTIMISFHRLSISPLVLVLVINLIVVFIINGRSDSHCYLLVASPLGEKNEGLSKSRKLFLQSIVLLMPSILLSECILCTHAIIKMQFSVVHLIDCSFFCIFLIWRG